MIPHRFTLCQSVTHIFSEKRANKNGSARKSCSEPFDFIMRYASARKVLCNIEHMVAHTFKVRKHFGINDTSLA